MFIITPKYLTVNVSVSLIMEMKFLSALVLFSKAKVPLIKWRTHRATFPWKDGANTACMNEITLHSNFSSVRHQLIINDDI